MWAGNFRDGFVGFDFADNRPGLDHIAGFDADIRDIDGGDTFRNFRKFEFDGHVRNDFGEKEKRANCESVTVGRR